MEESPQCWNRDPDLVGEGSHPVELPEVCPLEPARNLSSTMTKKVVCGKVSRWRHSATDLPEAESGWEKAAGH